MNPLTVREVQKLEAGGGVSTASVEPGACFEGSATTFETYVHTVYRNTKMPLLARSTQDRYNGIIDNYLIQEFGEMACRFKQIRLLVPPSRTRAVGCALRAWPRTRGNIRRHQQSQFGQGYSKRAGIESILKRRSRAGSFSSDRALPGPPGHCKRRRCDLRTHG